MFLDESHVMMGQLGGMYNGDRSSPLAVRDFVQNADLILDLGGIVLEDLNTGLWSNVIPMERMVSICDHWVQIGSTIYSHVAIDDMLDGAVAPDRDPPAIGGGRRGDRRHRGRRIEPGIKRPRLGS